MSDLYYPKSERFAQHLCCPICLGPSQPVHIDTAGIHVKNGADAYLASENVKGDVVVIPAWCEDGHEFVLMFGADRGSTYVWTERASHIAPEECKP